ncbi:MAG: DUF262 domain-containing protein, partial [Candidatus Aminicenantes bacterium]|nr:DUF262 domain-containing protein [Candidatus Aminicenantes bacterium]
RGWVWDDNHIISLIASISMSYPIGAIMMLETGNENVRFKSRPVEGIQLQGSIEPDQYILDGQQRLTSLFQSVFLDKAVSTRDFKRKDIKRWYYIDMEKSLDIMIDREDTILSIPEDKIIIGFGREVLADYSSIESEYKHSIFPLNKIFNPSAWRREYNKYWNHDEQKSNLFDNFEEKIIETFKQYQIPVIQLKKETPKEAVCQVFEKVNTGGVSLTVFELLTATFAADEYDLREDWNGKRKRLVDIESLGSVAKVLKAVQNDDVLQTISLLVTYDKRMAFLGQGGTIEKAPAVSCKRKEILKLTLEDYEQWSNQAIEGLIQSGRFLYSQNIFNYRDLPYRSQLVPLSAIFTVLGDKANNTMVKKKIIQWYWCGVLGELYGGAIETRFALDLVQIIDWVENQDTEPKTITDATFSASRLYSLQTRNSAAYKGIYALLMRDGGLDFISGDTITDQVYFDDKIDIHHIFPRKWCTDNNLARRDWNSIINKTAISAKTNRTIGGNAPSEYLEKIRKKAKQSEEELEEILMSHVIDPELLEANDFNGFISKRRDALLERIQNVMGKDVNMDIHEENLDLVYDDESDYDFEEELVE